MRKKPPIPSLKSRDIVIFSRQLATLQKAGVPLLKSLQIINSSQASKAIMTLTMNLKRKIETGYSFSNALKAQAIFTALFINLIAVGENTGKLAFVLSKFASYMERANNLKSKIINALYYPCVVLLVASLAIAILLIKVIPTFATIFVNLDASLSPLTKITLNLSRTLQLHWLKMVLILIVSIILLYIFRKNLLYKMPLTGALLHKLFHVQFCDALAISCAAGVPIQQAIEFIAKGFENKKYTLAINVINKKLIEGKNLSEAMQLSKIFPDLLIQMVTIGEETASLDHMLAKVASIYEEELDLSLERIVRLMEPILMLILGCMVGGLVIAIYLPVFNLGTVI